MDIKKLQEDFIDIISNVVISSDAKEVEELEKKAMSIVKELKEYINDDLDSELKTAFRRGTNSNNNRLYITVLDVVHLFDTQGYNTNKSTRIKNSTLVKIEKAIKELRGKTSKELGRISDSDHFNQHLEMFSRLGYEQSTNFLTQILICTGLATRLGAVLGSDGQISRVSNAGTMIGAILGGSLFVPLVYAGEAALILRLVDRNSETGVSARDITQVLLEPVNTNRIVLLAALGAGITTAVLRAGISPLTLTGGITPSGFNSESLGESLGAGIVSGIAAGIGATLSTTLLRRWVSPNIEDIDDVVQLTENGRQRQN